MNMFYQKNLNMIAPCACACLNPINNIDEIADQINLKNKIRKYFSDSALIIGETQIFYGVLILNN